MLDLRAEELRQLHLATCTAGCREPRDEWPTDDEQAEADCLLVIKREMTAEEEAANGGVEAASGAGRAGPAAPGHLHRGVQRNAGRVAH